MICGAVMKKLIFLNKDQEKFPFVQVVFYLLNNNHHPYCGFFKYQKKSHSIND